MRLASYSLEDAYAEQPVMGVIRRPSLTYQISTKGDPTDRGRRAANVRDGSSTDIRAFNSDFRFCPVN